MNPNPMIINITVPLPLPKLYSYKVSKDFEDRIKIGKRVLVPFGVRTITGYIIEIKIATPLKNLKYILDVLDDTPIFPESMLPLFYWISHYYIHPLGEVISCALPQGLNLADYETVSLTPTGDQIIHTLHKENDERKILEMLKPAPLKKKLLGIQLKKLKIKPLIPAMEKKGWIKRSRELMKASVKQKEERYIQLNPSFSKSIITGLSLKRQHIIEHLSLCSEISLNQLKAAIPNAARFIKPMEKDGQIIVSYKKVFRDPFGEAIEPESPHQLTDEQEDVLSKLSSSLGQGFSSYLLKGVTGSGKTEVYIQLTQKAMQCGLNVVILVPEIALISQIERAFRARFGERLAVLHSGLSKGERFDQWLKIAKGHVSIAIGARSCIFAPFEKLGLIIVDEEHDGAYKQENPAPRYHARDIAIVRAKMNNAVALLGSATPSIQTAYNVEVGKYKPLYLNHRIRNMPLPTIKIVDLNKVRDQRGIHRLLTPILIQKMKETLSRGEQVLLFLNRRGFANLSICKGCGEVLKCPNCDISLTLHQTINAYQCHYCDYAIATAKIKCKGCDARNIKILGYGTEKIGDALKAFFPDQEITRMDRDTTKHKGSILRILKKLKNHETDILIGTQMVAKGHDFPNITLVGVICADLSLNFPDFRAGERTFQLLAQVAGRAGRGEIPGSVILQTYAPDNFCILSARDQDDKAFYEKEIVHRKVLNYPPFAKIIQLRISGEEKDEVITVSKELGRLLKISIKKDPWQRERITILGPIEAPLSKIAKKYRWQILLKGGSAVGLNRFIQEFMKTAPKKSLSKNIRITIDVDPYFMM